MSFVYLIYIELITICFSLFYIELCIYIELIIYQSINILSITQTSPIREII